MSKSRAKIINKLASRGWISLSQMADLIGISYPTMLAIRDRKEIACTPIGHNWRIYEEEVERYLSEGNLKPQQEVINE